MWFRLLIKTDFPDSTKSKLWSARANMGSHLPPRCRQNEFNEPLRESSLTWYNLNFRSKMIRCRSIRDSRSLRTRISTLKSYLFQLFRTAKQKLVIKEKLKKEGDASGKQGISKRTQKISLHKALSFFSFKNILRFMPEVISWYKL